jgi:hypothetical protein
LQSKWVFIARHSALFQSASVGAKPTLVASLDLREGADYIFASEECLADRLNWKGIYMTQSLPADEILTQVYLRFDVPSDSLVRSPSHMQRFIEELPIESRSVEPESVADRIIRLRKDGKLPRLRRSPK